MVLSVLVLCPPSTSEVGVAKERVIVLARRLLLVSANSGAAVTIIFGIMVIVAESWVLARGWLHLKLLRVLLMLMIQLRLYQRIRALRRGPARCAPL